MYVYIYIFSLKKLELGEPNPNMAKKCALLVLGLPGPTTGNKNLVVRRTLRRRQLTGGVGNRARRRMQPCAARTGNTHHMWLGRKEARRRCPRLPPDTYAPV
jgi:hypothetical protein